MPDDTPKFSHLDEAGKARMVDVSGKEVTRRKAEAACRVELGPGVYQALVEARIPKGDVLAVARVAGIQAAKRTGEWIPLCHPLPIDQVEVDLEPSEATHSLEIRSRVVCTARTGAEMEAMTACAAAALTVYDFCKALSRGVRITDLRLTAKSGGKSGPYTEDVGSGPSGPDSGVE